MPTVATLAGRSAGLADCSMGRRGEACGVKDEESGGRVSEGERRRSWAARSVTGSTDRAGLSALPSETDAGIFRAEGAGRGRLRRREGCRTV